MTAQARLSPWLTAGAVVFAIATPTIYALADLGLNAKEFARDGQATLRAASYAFSIWTLIYAWLAAYAVYRFRSSARASALDAQLGLPAFISIAGCGLWIMASAADWKVATVVIIVASAVTLTAALTHAAKESIARSDWLWLVAPLSLLAGWLTIATALNALTVGTALGLLDGMLADIAAGTGVVLVGAAGFFVASRRLLWMYALPIAWGLAAVVVAEFGAQPYLALTAGGAAAMSLVGAALGFFSQPQERTGPPAAGR